MKDRWCIFSTDTRTTQWEDPRLKNSAITGPVSIVCEILKKTEKYSLGWLKGF